MKLKSVTPACPVVVFLMATDEKEGVKNAIESLTDKQYSYEILEYGKPWLGWPQRMEAYAKAAESQPKEQLIMFMDAYDALAFRPWDGLVETFKSFNKPIVGGMETFCGGNCKPLTEWWKSEMKTTPPATQYVNGGLIMGEAGYLAKAYRWMLKEKHADDQIGMASYILSHPTEFGPDVTQKLFANRILGDKVTQQEWDLKGAYFIHFPGVSIPIQSENYRQVCNQRLSKKTPTTSMLPICIVVILLVIILGVFLLAWNPVRNKLVAQHVETRDANSL